MPKLTVESGRDKGRFAIIGKEGTITVGRDPRCDVQLTDPMSSRRHFSITGVNGSYIVKDLGSKNGTFLNGKPLAESKIQLGDQIAVGETLLSFLHESEEKLKGGVVGSTIGGYRILERIGRGGMGTVYKATQLSLDRTVALKILAPHLVKDTNFIQRFVREARSAGRLNHPNIVQALDVGSEGETYYFSMEYMAGGSLQERLRQESRLPLAAALKVALDVARGLEYAESQGVIHRDIKPDNIMFDAAGHAKIGDLGIAEILEEGRRSFVQAAGVWGSAHYMAPEQAAGAEIDHRVDIYSLGATLYRTLAGRTLFTGASLKEIMDKQINEAPVPITQFVPDLPPQVVRVLEKMLAKNPSARYPNASVLLKDIASLIENPNEPPPSFVSKARVGARLAAKRRKTGALLGVVIVVVGLALGAAGLAIAFRKNPARELLNQAWDLEKQDRVVEAAALYEKLVREFPSSPEAEEAQRHAADLRQAMLMAEKEKKEKAALAALETAKGLEREADPLLEASLKSTDQEPPSLDPIIAAYTTVVRDFPDTDAARTAAEKAAKLLALKKRYDAAQSDLSNVEIQTPRLISDNRYREVIAKYEELLATCKNTPVIPKVRKKIESLKAESLRRYLNVEEEAYGLAQKKLFAEAAAKLQSALDKLWLSEQYRDRAETRRQEYQDRAAQSSEEPPKPAVEEKPAEPQGSAHQPKLDTALQQIQDGQYGPALATLKELANLPDSERLALKLPPDTTLPALIQKCEAKLKELETDQKAREETLQKARRQVLDIYKKKREKFEKGVRAQLATYLGQREQKIYEAASLAAAAGFWDVAVQTYAILVRRQPNCYYLSTGDALLSYCACLVRLGKASEADQVFANCTRLVNYDYLPDVRAGYKPTKARVEGEMKQYRQQLKDLEENAADPAFLLRLAYAAVSDSVSDRVTGAALFSTLLTRFKDSPLLKSGDPEWRYQFALRALGDHKDAIEVLDEFATKYPGSPHIRSGELIWQRGEAYYEAGRKKEAIRFYRLLKTDFPNHYACRPRYEGRAPPMVDVRLDACR